MRYLRAIFVISAVVILGWWMWSQVGTAFASLFFGGVAGLLLLFFAIEKLESASCKTKTVIMSLMFVGVGFWMWSQVGGVATKMYFCVAAGTIFLFRILPKLLGDPISGATDQDPDMMLDPNYSSIPGNVFHKQD